VGEGLDDVDPAGGTRELGSGHGAMGGALGGGDKERGGGCGANGIVEGERGEGEWGGRVGCEKPLYTWGNRPQCSST
jgi:hypothetical protein